MAYMAEFTSTSVNNKVHTGSTNSQFKEQQYFQRAVVLSNSKSNTQ